MKRKQQERRPPAKSIRSELFRSRAIRDLPGADWPEERRLRDGLPVQLVPVRRQPKPEAAE